jgi:hypothetical protein
LCEEHITGSRQESQNHHDSAWSRSSGPVGTSIRHSTTCYTMDQARCTAIINARKHRCGRSSSAVSLGVIERHAETAGGASANGGHFVQSGRPTPFSGTRYRDRQRPLVPCLRSLSHALDRGRPRRVGRLVPVSVRFPTLSFIASASIMHPVPFVAYPRQPP